MSPALSEALLRRLQEELGDPATVAEIIGLFLQEAPANLAELRQAAADGDLERVRRAAHTLKSTSLQLGAAELSEAAKAVEAEAREGRLPGAAAVGRLDSLWAAAKGELERHRASLAAA